MSDELTCSESILAELGYPSDRPSGSAAGFLSLMHADDVEVFWYEIDTCIESCSRVDVDFRLRTASGEARWFRACGSAVADEMGVISNVSGEMRDISIEREAIRDLREAERQLHQQKRMDALDCLAGGIAHEFNNVLQAVRGYVAFAMDELEVGSQPHEDLRQAVEATDRASRLTRSLLDFARAEDQASEHFDARDVINGLGSLLRPVIGEDVSFRVVEGEPSMPVFCELQCLREALLNLCINSRDAMPDGGELVVSASEFMVDDTTVMAVPDLEKGPYCRIQVTDNGSGMSAGIRAKVFDPFFSTKEVGRGTGLGLATVYGFAQRSGGAVTVYSEEGLGTTFSIYLPMELPMEDQDMSRSPLSADLLAERPSLVLLIEDDQQVQEVGRRCLEAAGYEVLVASDGESGLETYIANVDRVELVVLDVVLPRLGGRRVFEEIRRLQSEVPVIFTTGFDPESTLGANGGQLANKTLAKPYDRRGLLREVKALIQGRQASPAVAGERA